MNKKLLLGLIVSVSLLVCMPLPAAEESNMDALALLYQSRDLMKTVDDYSAVFVKEEKIKGKMRKPETIFFKFKRPFMVYMKWIKNPHKGRELLYIKGKNNDDIKVHIGGILNLILPSINISPDSSHVKDNTRHSIRDAGLENMINSLISQFELAKNNGDLVTHYLGEEDVNGTDTYKFERILPKDKGYYCHRLVLNVGKSSGIPLKVQVYDWDDKLMERYTYTKIDLDIDLTEKDFDSRNREYAFGLF